MLWNQFISHIKSKAPKVDVASRRIVMFFTVRVSQAEVSWDVHILGCLSRIPRTAMCEYEKVKR